MPRPQHAGKCCADYRKSKYLKCEGCNEWAQVMPTLGMCQVCTFGSASFDRNEVWRMHSKDCHRVKKEKANG